MIKSYPALILAVTTPNDREILSYSKLLMKVINKQQHLLMTIIHDQMKYFRLIGYSYPNVRLPHLSKYVMPTDND